MQRIALWEKLSDREDERMLYSIAVSPGLSRMKLEKIEISGSSRVGRICFVHKIHMRILHTNNLRQRQVTDIFSYVQRIMVSVCLLILEDLKVCCCCCCSNCRGKYMKYVTGFCHCYRRKYVKMNDKILGRKEEE